MPKPNQILPIMDVISAATERGLIDPTIRKRLVNVMPALDPEQAFYRTIALCVFQLECTHGLMRMDSIPFFGEVEPYLKAFRQVPGIKAGRIRGELRFFDLLEAKYPDSHRAVINASGVKKEKFIEVPGTKLLITLYKHAQVFVDDENAFRKQLESSATVATPNTTTTTTFSAKKVAPILPPEEEMGSLEKVMLHGDVDRPYDEDYPLKLGINYNFPGTGRTGFMSLSITETNSIHASFDCNYLGYYEKGAQMEKLDRALESKFLSAEDFADTMLNVLYITVSADKKPELMEKFKIFYDCYEKLNDSKNKLA